MEDCYRKETTINGEKVVLEIIDTAGTEQFRSITTMYFRNAVAAIVVYDVTDSLSFEKVGEWVNNIKQNSAPEILICLIGNKIDLVDFSQGTFDRIAAEFRDFASRLSFDNIVAIPISARYGDNVIAAEVHQNSRTDGRAVFDLALDPLAPTETNAPTRPEVSSPTRTDYSVSLAWTPSVDDTSTGSR